MHALKDIGLAPREILHKKHSKDRFRLAYLIYKNRTT
jgi:uncharacterized protein YjiS (DUF1127 family)